MNDTFMKEKPIFPLLTSMALPMVISMLVNALYNIVDSLFVAQISEDAMTALSLVYREEDACAKEGLDWTRAEQTYGDHDHDHDDEADWDDDFGDAGIMDDDGMTGAYPGFN